MPRTDATAVFTGRCRGDAVRGSLVLRSIHTCASAFRPSCRTQTWSDQRLSDQPWANRPWVRRRRGRSTKFGASAFDVSAVLGCSAATSLSFDAIVKPRETPACADADIKAIAAIRMNWPVSKRTCVLRKYNIRLNIVQPLPKKVAIPPSMNFDWLVENDEPTAKSTGANQ
jgi:hypothetical protein